MRRGSCEYISILNIMTQFCAILVENLCYRCCSFCCSLIIRSCAPSSIFCEFCMRPKQHNRRDNAATDAHAYTLSCWDRLAICLLRAKFARRSRCRRRLHLV